MKILIKNIAIADPSSEFNNKVVDVYIEDGKYVRIGEADSIKEKDKSIVEWDGSGCFLSPGWLDMHANFREPGEEMKETIRSGQRAAWQGGFTSVLLMPSTSMPIQSRSDVALVLAKSEGHPVKVLQAGALTINRAGEELTEINDLIQGGAIAFTDDKRTIQNAGIMLRALQYVGASNKKIIAFAEEKSLSNHSLANESLNTTVLGFKGSPNIAEKIALERDLSLVAYTMQPMHFSGISTKEGIELIRNAKANKLPITADTYAHLLLLDDSYLSTFDSNYKVKPPLRSLEDIEALKSALLDGTIDSVASDHSPEDKENKDVEFDFAAFGMIGCETAFSVINTAFQGKLSPLNIATWLGKNPYAILNIELPVVKIGAPANFTCFNMDEKWTFEKQHIRSQSQNTPFINFEFTGRVKAIGHANAFEVLS
jgi:dihydroorotase